MPPLLLTNLAASYLLSLQKVLTHAIVTKIEKYNASKNRQHQKDY